MPILRQPTDPVKAALARRLRSEMTTSERLLWEHLRHNRLGGLHFRRQQVIAGFIVDFYCHARQLVVEIDGPVHAQQQIEDAERERILKERGLAVIRFSNAAVENDLQGVLAAILAVAGT